MTRQPYTFCAADPTRPEPFRPPLDAGDGTTTGDRRYTRGSARAVLVRTRVQSEGAMATKADFSAEQWNQLLESPMLASIAVTAAEPSGLWGMLQESFAAGGRLAKAKTDPDTNQLVKAVVADFASGEGRGVARDALQARLQGSKPAEAKDKAVEGLRQVAALLDAKAPNDAAAFKAWLQSISQHVAEAAKEGGFLGFGGVQVSDAEKATLAEIADAMRLKA